MKRLPALLEPRRSRLRDDQLLQSDLGRASAPRVEEPKREPNWQRRAHEAEQRTADAMAYLGQIAASTGGLLDRWQAPPVNDVLLQGTYKIGSQGWTTWSWKQAFSAVAIGNTTLSPLTVTSFAPGDSMPTTGTGIFTVAPGFWRVVPVRGTTLTVWGPSGSSFDLAVFVRPRTPSAGAVAIPLGQVITAYPPDPPPGTRLKWAAPTTAPIEFLGIWFNLTTAATVATRQVVIKLITPGTRNYFAVIFSHAQAAGIVTGNYLAAPGAGTQFFANYYSRTLPPGPWPPGGTLQIKANNMAPTDQLHHFRITYRLYPNGAG